MPNGFGISLEELARANQKIANPNYIEPGWVLMIPPKGSGCTRHGSSESLDQEEARAQGETTLHPRIYVVQKGDSLYSIAHNITKMALER